MTLSDCAINKKCCTVDGGRGICPLFSSPPRGICQLKSPHPREFAIQGKKNANFRGSARGGLGAGGIDWCIIVHSICELILCPVTFAFLRRTELKPACILLLVVTVSFFTCPDLFTFAEPALSLSYVKEPEC